MSWGLGRGLRRGAVAAAIVAVAPIGGASAVAAGQPGPSFAVAAADVGAQSGGPFLAAPQLPSAPRVVRISSLGGAVLPFGGAGYLGSLAGVALNKPVVGMAATSDGKGYWLTAADGGIFPFGDAKYYGSLGRIPLNQPIVGMAATTDSKGYWLTAADGGIFPFGDAKYYGSLGRIPLNQPIVGMAATTDSKGYWLTAADGGTFPFGDAKYYGSLGRIPLNQPIVGMAATTDSKGYWLTAADGGTFPFGDAKYYGSLGRIPLNQPIVGMAATTDSKGYWLTAADGGTFPFGDARFRGSAAHSRLAQPVIGMVRDPGGGYWLFEGRRQAQVASPFASSLVAALHQRSGTITAALFDLRTGTEYLYAPGQLEITASIVKVEILGSLMSEAQQAGRQLNSTELGLAASMIEDSDNNSATSLWNEVGGASAVESFDRSVGMTSTTPASAWGLTVTSAADQIALLQHVLLPNPELSTASRAYMLSLMESVTPSQAWGVSAGTSAGTTVALKNGWLPVGSTWQVNSIGWIAGSGRDYLLAVLTSGDPDEAYGIQSISLIAQAAWNTLRNS